MLNTNVHICVCEIQKPIQLHSNWDGNCDFLWLKHAHHFPQKFFKFRLWKNQNKNSRFTSILQNSILIKYVSMSNECVFMNNGVLLMHMKRSLNNNTELIWFGNTKFSKNLFVGKWFLFGQYGKCVYNHQRIFICQEQQLRFNFVMIRNTHLFFDWVDGRLVWIENERVQHICNYC